MTANVCFLMSILLLGLMPALGAQNRDFEPVTQETLLNPSPNDWLMYSRTYDNQRFSPLDQINQSNVGRLSMAWTRGMHPGTQENIPLVYRGVMYVANPGAIIQALDATNGDLIWEYRRRLPRDLADYIRAIGRARTLAIYGDQIFYASPEGYLVALNAQSGELRWETEVHDYKSETQHTTGPMVIRGKVITGRNCGITREYCFIAAHDAQTGKELWRFHTTAGPGEPGGDTWGTMPADKRLASPWGLPAGYDPELNLMYWGVANPAPHTRIKRHDGNPFDVPLAAPSELYSNSTLALNPDTGELAWYYQHLPGDDWDSDHTQERILLRTRFNPAPNSVKWINPQISRGVERNVVVSMGEPGGLWVLDREDGEFLWTTPFPYDTPDFHISHIDVETGRTHISRDKVLTKDGEKHLTCFQNTKGYWPMAFHPEKNALYIPYHDACVERVGDLRTENGHNRTTLARPGSDPDAFTGIAKVDMGTGEIDRIYQARVPGNGSMLATAGNLIFWGDINRRMRAFNADSGAILWETIVGGVIQTSTITYSVNGKQYLAVLTGDGLSGTSGPLRVVTELKTPRGHNAIYVFALRD